MRIALVAAGVILALLSRQEEPEGALSRDAADAAPTPARPGVSELASDGGPEVAPAPHDPEVGRPVPVPFVDLARLRGSELAYVLMNDRDRVLPRLRALLGHAEPAVRREAVRQTRIQGKWHALWRELIGLARDDPDRNVRNAAHDMVAGCEQAVPDLVQMANAGTCEDWKAVVTLGKTLRPAAFDALLEIARSDHRERNRALFSLSKFGDRAKDVVPLLLERLRDSHGWVRAGVVRSLGEIGDRRAADALLTAPRTDENEVVRSSAVEAIRPILGVEAVPHLGHALHDPDEFVRGAAVRQLGKMKHRSVEPPLVAALDDETIRHEAILAITERGPLCRSAVSKLIPLLSDEEMGEDAAAALTAITGEEWKSRR